VDVGATSQVNFSGIEIVPATHGGGTYLSFDRRDPSGVPTGFVARLDGSGLRVLHSLKPLDTFDAPGLVWDTTLASLVSTPVMARLGHGVREWLLPLVTLDDDGEVIGQGLPWPYAQDLLEATAQSDVSVIGGVGRAHIVHCAVAFPESECRVGLLGFDPANADLDRDGVSHAREVALGLDDRDPDVDDDGASDAVELHYGFDPLDPSQPIRGDAPEVLAPSSFPGDWVGDFVGAYRERDHGVALCEQVVAPLNEVEHTCHGPDGETLPFGGFPVPPAFSPDAQVAFFQTPTQYGRQRTDVGLRMRRAGATTDEPALDEAVAADWAGLSFDASTLQVLGADLFYHRWGDRLTRFHNGRPHLVIDLARADCPIVATAADLTRCGADDLRMAWQIGWHVVGVDAARQELLVFVSSGPRRQVLAIGTDRVSVAFDVSALPGGLEPQRLIALPAALGPGWLVPLRRHDPTEPLWTYLGSAVLDVGLRVRNPAQPPIDGEPGAWFHGGFPAIRGQPFWVFPFNGNCQDGFFDFCGEGSASSDPRRVMAPDPTAWVATPLGLGPGDTVLFSGLYSTWASGGIAWVDEDGALGSGNPGDGDWNLWRIADGGGTLRWLDRATFGRLADDLAAGASATPVGPITHLGVRPDARRVCLIEGGADRAWEVATDSLGIAEVVHVVAGPPGLSACGYAADGRLALLGADTLRIGSEDHAVDGGPGAELVRVGERWLIAPTNADATCLGGGDTGLRMVAAAAVDDIGVAWVDDLGGSFAGPIESVCAGTGATEVMLDGHLWDQSMALFWHPSAGGGGRVATGGAMTVRADGAVVYTTTGIESSYFDDLLYRARPTWRPLDWNQRLRSLDTARRVTPRLRPQSLELRRVTALATVPGGTTTPSTWSYFARTPPPPVTEPVEPAPEPEPEPDPERPKTSDEGCAGGPGGVALLSALAFVLAARRPRSRSAGDT
jgi:hypothetical protein